MTIDTEMKQIRSEVALHPPGRGRRYPRALRQRILKWLKRAQEAGRLEAECSREIGVALVRIDRWREAERHIAATVVPEPTVPEATAETSLVPVVLRDQFPFGPMISFVMPSGHRVEGLTLDQALGMLRAFA